MVYLCYGVLTTSFFLHAASWTDVNDNFYVFGGHGAGSDLLCDLWVSSPKTGWSASGSSPAANTSGVYPGALQSSVCGASACMPGCRSDAVTWVTHGSTRSSLYLFGGYGYGATTGPGQLNDLWVYDTQLLTWTWLHGSNEIGAAAVYTGSSASLDPGARSGSASAVIGTQLWLHGGKYGFVDPPVTPITPPTTPPVAAPVAAPITAPVPAPVDTPVPAPVAAPVTAPVNAPVDPPTPIPAPVDAPVPVPVAVPVSVPSPVPTAAPVDPPVDVPSPVNVPAPIDAPIEAKRAIRASTTIADEDLFSFERRTEYDAEAAAAVTYIADTWYYDSAANNWVLIESPSAVASIQLAVNGNPGPRTSHTGFSYNGFFYVFGGLGYDTSTNLGPLNDYYMYDSTNLDWVFLAGSPISNSAGGTSLISARYDPASWTDTSNNVWFFGGFGTDNAGTTNVYLPDIWTLNPSTNTWTNVVSGTGSPASCTTTCGSSPNCANIGVSTSSNRIGARSGAASFWRRQSNYGSIFGGRGYDCNSNYRYLQDTWDVANTAPTPIITRPITLANLTSGSLAAGYTLSLTGSYLGYLPGTLNLDTSTGIMSCTIDSASFSSAAFNCLFPTSSSSIGSGPVTATYTSTYAMSSSSITVFNIRPSLSSPSSSLTFLANATSIPFTVNGAGFGATTASLSAAVLVNGLGTRICTISALNAAGTSFTCTLPSTSAYSGPFTLTVTYITASNGNWLSDSVSFGNVQSVVAPLATLPGTLSNVNNAPTTITLTGNGFGNTAATISIVFGGGDTRTCTPTSVAPTSITCTLSGGSSVAYSGYYWASVNVGGVTSPLSDIGALLPVITVPSTLPTAGASSPPTSYTIPGVGFSQTMSEMSVTLTFPGVGSPTRNCVVSSTSSTSVTCSVTSPPSGYSGIVTALVGRFHTGSSSAGRIFNSTTANIMSLTASITSGAITTAANAASITLAGQGLNGASVAFVTHGSLSVPTCTAATTTTSTSIVCALSGVFLESGLYDYVLTDASGSAPITYSNNITVNPAFTLRGTEYLDSIKTLTTFTVTGAGFGATGTGLTVTLSNGAACSVVTSLSPTSFNCSLTSSATTAGYFSLAVAVGSYSSGVVANFAQFRPMITTSAFVFPASTTPTLTLRGAAFLGNTVSAMVVSITGPACGTNPINTCTCGTVNVINGTALTCVMTGQRSSGSLNAQLVVGTYPSSTAVIGVIKPVVRVSTSNIVSTAKTLSIIADPSTGFGNNVAVVSVTLSSGSCTVTDVATGSLTCSLASAPNAGELDATVTVNSVSSDSTQVASVIAAPVITASTSQLSIASSDVIFYGSNFGTTLGISVNLSTSAGQTCSPAFVNNTMIRCTPVAINGQSAFPSAGSTLRVLITKDGGYNTPGTDSDGFVAIAKMVAVPVATPSSLSLANTAPFLNISGSSFSTVAADVSVALTLAGSTINTAWYSVYSVTNTRISLALTADWAGLTSLGPISAVVTVARGSGASAVVATLARVPTVTSSSNDIATTSTSLLVSGSGFQPTGVDPATMTIAMTITYSASSFNCAATGTDTQLTCTIPSNPPTFVTGTAVYVSALTINGLSMTSGPVQIGTFRAIPFIETATTPAFQLGASSALSFSATSIPSSSISVIIADTAGNLAYCTSPTVSATPAGIISCEPRTWSNAGIITAQLVGSGGIKSVVTTVGYVRAQATITSATAKIGRKTTTLTINGNNFSPLSPIGTQNALTLTVNGVSLLSTVAGATATSLSVTFPTGANNPAGNLMASITVATVPMSGGAVQVATIVEEPAPATSENSISLYATSFAIGGTSLSFSSSSTSSVTLSNAQGTVFNCASVSPGSATSVTCNLASGTVLPAGPLSLTAMTLDGVNSLSGTIVVATALPIPVITSSTSKLNPDSVTITGTNFSSPRTINVSLSSGSCSIVATGADSVTCQIPQSTVFAGPLYATVTIQNGVTSALTQIGYVNPSINLSSTRSLISSTTFSLTGYHFSADTSKVSVVLQSTMNELQQDCTVTSSSLTALKCSATDLLYAGTLRAVVSVTGSDGLPYSSDSNIVATIAPVLISNTVYANVTSGNLTIEGIGFNSTIAATGVLVNFFTDAKAATTAIPCNVSTYSYYAVNCWFNTVPTGGVYTAIVYVNTGAGTSQSDPDPSLAIAPVIAEGAFGSRRSLLALPDLTTDSTKLEIPGTGFSSTPKNNFVQLSSGYCDVTNANSSFITCRLYDIDSGTLSARVSTNAVSSTEWTAVANVVQGSPRTPSTPELFPTANNTSPDGTSTGPSSSSQGWTAGAIAGVVLAAIFALIIVLIVAFTFLLLRKSAGSTANRLLRAAKRGPNARTRSRSARSNTSSTSISPYPTSPGSVRRKDLSKLTSEEEDFVRRIAFADSAGQEGALELAPNDDYLFDSSSEYLYRDESSSEESEESEYEYDDEDGEELEEEDVESGLQSDQDGASNTQNGDEEEEEEEYEEEDEEEEEEGEEEEEEEEELAESKTSSSSEYLYTSGSSEASSSK